MKVYIRANAFVVGDYGMPFRYAYQNTRCPHNWTESSCGGNFGEDYANNPEHVHNAHTVLPDRFSAENYKAFRRWYDKYINNMPIKQVTEKDNR